MDMLQILIGGIFVAIVVCISGIVLIKVFFISSTEGAVKRLSEEIAAAEAQKTDLKQRIKESEEDLARKKEEARLLAEKMRTDAEEQSKTEREKMIISARKEAEEIIIKAQGAKDMIRKEIQKEEDLKVIQLASEMLNVILSQKAKGALDHVLIDEFIEKLKDVDMTRISPDIKAIDIITVNPVDEAVKKQISKIIKDKLGRELSMNASVDAGLGGGVIVKFGSMSLDGSIRNLIREQSIKGQEVIEHRG